MVARWINLILGAWLIVAPWILSYNYAAARQNDLWVGILVIIAAIVAMFWGFARFANTALGIWLIIAPFVLGYGAVNAATFNDVIVGAVIVALSFVPTAVGVRGARPAAPVPPR